MKLRILLLGGIAVALVGCGDRKAEQPVVNPEAKTPAEATETVLSRTPSAEGARLFFITPADGATVSNPISAPYTHMPFGVTGEVAMSVAM